MARLPQPGGDNGDWGVILNDFLAQSLTGSGTLKSNVVGSAQLANDAVTGASIADSTITETQLDSALRAKVNTAGGGAVDSVNTQIGAVVLDQDDIGDGITFKQYSATEKTKLSGVATAATANSSDATLLARSNHTGTQSADTITDGTTNKAYTANEKTKLAGVAAGATANVGDVTLTGTQTLTNKTIASPVITGTPTGITKAHVGLGNADDTSDVNKPISTAVQTALDAKASTSSVGAKVMVYNSYADAPALPVNTVVVSITGA